VDVALTPDDTHLYWTDYDRVQRLPKIGGEIETVAVAATNVPQTIAVDDGYVYWVDAQFGSFRLAGKGRLRAIRKRDGALVDLLGADRVIDRVVADGRDVWLLVGHGSSQQLHRLRGWQACHGAGDGPR
jgi:hypothetical protein